MEDKLKRIFKSLNPREGCVVCHFHGVQLLNYSWGSSITYLFSRLITSSQIKEVQIVEFSEIIKSMQHLTT